VPYINEKPPYLNNLLLESDFLFSAPEPV